MKAAHLFLPVVALGAISSYVVWQRRELASVEKERSALHAKPPSAPPATPTNGGAKPIPLAGPADWKKAATALHRLFASKNPEERKGITRFTEQFDTMGTDEILATMDGVAAEKWEDAPKGELESMLMTALIKKSPELALRHFADRIEKQGFAYNQFLQGALKTWATTDLAGATAWFNEAIEKGNFDTTALNQIDSVWMAYESALIQAAMSQDIEAAIRRVEGIPPRMQRHVLMLPMGPQVIDARAQIGYAKLCRRFLEDDDIATVLDWLSSSAVMKGGYSEVSAFMDRFELTSAEKAKVAEQVAITPLRSVAGTRKVTMEDIETVREWASSHGSRKVENITGRAIGSVAGSPATGLDAAYEMVGNYYARSGNDQVLAGFLGWPVVWTKKEAAQALLEKIRNEQTRKRILRDVQ